MQRQRQQLAPELVTEQENDESYNATPICGGNYCSTVVEPTYYLDEIFYTIGGRQYISNAD
jgi:hypothetical protein